MIRGVTIVVAAGVGVSMAACSVGPDYEAPDLSPRTGDQWIEVGSQDAAEDLSEWWSRFDDPQLAELVERSFEGSLTLAEARERVVQARARRGIENAARLPLLDADAGYSYSESGEDSASFTGAPPGTSADIYRVGVVAGWELDLWDRVGRLVEAADADIEASIEDLRAARTALAAEVARELVLIRALDARIGVVERSVGLRRDSLSIAESRSRAGLVSELDALRARRDLESDLALIPDLRAQRRATELRLAVLLGERPGEVDVVPHALPTTPAIPSLGLPGELVTRRPDIRRAERQLAATTARIGSAEAERYPRVTVSGEFSFSATEPSGLFNSAARSLALGPTVTLPILTGGRIASGIELAESEARAALLSLESIALDAVREVETALSNRARTADRLVRLDAAAAAADETESLASDLYAAGRTDFLDVLDAQRSVLSIEERLVLAREAELVQTIDLFTALGGGWSPPVGTTTANAR
ncbi:MAG: efflux transporter outer membrane subunit [Phycisphaerales bacterium]|nr:efflux transporter outer membrane subunit [Phycisphaerales bacterium]